MNVFQLENLGDFTHFLDGINAREGDHGCSYIGRIGPSETRTGITW